MPRHLSPVALALLTTLAPSQQRQPTFVSVVDDAGAALVGAVVTLIGGHPHLAASLQDVDVLRVETGARGRAIAKLLPGASYVAWAEADGRRSAVRGFFAAGALLEVVVTEPVAARAIEVRGLDAWAHLGPLRCFAMTMVPGAEEELTRGDDGRVQMPAPPFDSLEVRAADGRPLWRASVHDSGALVMPPPRDVRVRVTDEAGAPLAGAEVLHRVGHVSSWRLDGLRGVGEERLRLVGETDEHGACTVQVPCTGDPLRDPREDMLLFARAPRRPAVAGGAWRGSHYVDDRRVPRVDGGVLTFTCRPVEPLVGVVPNAPKGTTAHLAAVCKLHLPRGGYQNDARVFTAPVRANGAFVFEDVPAELHSCRLSIVPPTDSDWAAPVFAPEAARELPAEVRRLPGAEPQPFSFGAASLQVLDARGGPARGAVAFVSSGDRRGVLLRDSLIRVPLDARGATRLRLVPGNWVLVVVTEEAFGAREFVVGGADVGVELQLEQLARMRVRLLDGAGAPVAGATVRSRGTATRGTNDPVDSILQGLQRTRHVHWARLRTDADGRVDVPFVPVPGVAQRLELRWATGVSEEFELRADDERVVGPKGAGGERLPLPRRR